MRPLFRRNRHHRLRPTGDRRHRMQRPGNRTRRLPRIRVRNESNQILIIRKPHVLIDERPPPGEHIVLKRRDGHILQATARETPDLVPDRVADVVEAGEEIERRVDGRRIGSIRRHGVQRGHQLARGIDAEAVGIDDGLVDEVPVAARLQAAHVHVADEVLGDDDGGADKVDGEAVRILEAELAHAVVEAGGVFARGRIIEAQDRFSGRGDGHGG